jgi:protein tyrosine/serine phosphatase
VAVPGVENVGLVAPGIYRGAAPDAKGLDALKALGIKTVVNLRHYHGATEEKLCRERGLDYVSIVLESSDAPSDEDAKRFLAVVTDPDRQPVYFHCWRGKDRTGAMCAAYRIAIEGWTLQEARREMEAFGFFPGWRDLWNWVGAFAARPR